MNFTVNGACSNEELLIAFEGGSAKKLKKQINKYIENLSKNEKIKKYTKEDKVPVISLRDLFLDGLIWYETKEVLSLFNIPLEKSQLDTLSSSNKRLEGVISIKNASFNIIKFIENSFKLKNVDFDIQTSNDDEGVDESKKSKIKNYLLQTSFGYWSPKEFYEKIDEEIEKLKTLRKIAIDKIQKIFQNDNCFDQLKGDLVLIFEENSQIWGVDKKTVETRLETLQKKLKDKNYIQRLISPWHCVDMPDIWEDNLAVEEFYNSINDELIYKTAQIKPQNILAKGLKNLNWKDNSTNPKEFLENNIANINWFNLLD